MCFGRLVKELVRLDRLPKENTLEALLLLQQAWVSFDVCMYLSRWYKRLSRILYAILLLIGILTVAFTILTTVDGLSLASLPTPSASTEERQRLVGNMKHVVFGLSLASTVVLTTTRFLNPTQRGRQLRASASALESTIWRFRTRVGQVCE